MVVLCLAALARLYLASAHATEEDFYITLRYAQNIAAGYGFVYNPGQHVLGTTTPLFTLFLAFLIRIGWNPTVFATLAGIAADIAAGLFTYRAGKAAGSPAAGLAAAICVEFAPLNLVWSVKGMEAGIVAALAAAAWCLWIEKRDLAAWICAAILLLLRIDGAALALVMLGATIVRYRRVPWRCLAAYIIIVSPWMVFAFIRFGSPVPLSLSAKLTVYSRLIPGAFPQLAPFLRIMLHNPLGALVAAGLAAFAVLAVMDLREPASQRRPAFGLLAGPLVWIAAYYAGMALSHVFLFGWYFVPPSPLYYLISMAGFAALAERLPALKIGLRPAHAPAAWLGAAGLMACLTVPRAMATLRRGQEVESQLRIPIGMWLRDHVAPEETVMLEPIGYIGYYSRARIIDEIGLVSPEALPSYRSDVACPEHDLWERLKPDWMLLRAGELTKLRACEQALPISRQLDAGYQPVKQWSDPQAPGAPAAFYLFHRRQPGPNSTKRRERMAPAALKL